VFLSSFDKGCHVFYKKVVQHSKVMGSCSPLKDGEGLNMCSFSECVPEGSSSACRAYSEDCSSAYRPYSEGCSWGGKGYSEGCSSAYRAYSEGCMGVCLASLLGCY